MSKLPFRASDYNALSVRALANTFRQVGVCDGYVFMGQGADICSRKEAAVLKSACSGKGIESCTFNAVYSTDASNKTTAVTFSVSMAIADHILPSHLVRDHAALTFSNATGIPAKTFKISTRSAIPSYDGTVVLAAQRFGSAVIIDEDDGTLTIWPAISDDVNSEAIAYTVLLMILFGYFVFVSGPLLANKPPSKVTKFLVSNTSFSLFMGSLVSIIDVSAYSHQYTPIETDILLGDYGPQKSKLLPGCMLCINAIVALFVILELRRPKLPSPIMLRCLFESQLILNLILTVPPSAGQAFRISLGFFFGSLLSLIIGRDSCALFLKPNHLFRKAIFLAVAILIYVLAVIDLVAPMIWSARMASVNRTIFMAHLWVTNIGVAGMAFCIFNLK